VAQLKDGSCFEAEAEKAKVEDIKTSGCRSLRLRCVGFRSPWCEDWPGITNEEEGESLRESSTLRSKRF